MIYYLEELHFSSSWDLSSLYKSSTKETTILSDDGLYKMNHNKMNKYKIIPINKSFHIKNYIHNYTLISADYEYKKQGTLSVIPYNHVVLQTQVDKYRLHPKSSTAFVIINYKNIKKDFYFESSLSPHDSSLHEDILSLLSYLK